MTGMTMLGLSCIAVVPKYYASVLRNCYVQRSLVRQAEAWCEYWCAWDCGQMVSRDGSRCEGCQD